MMPHICVDEIVTFFSILAGVKLIPFWIRGVWAARHKKPACKHEEDHHGGV